MLIKHTKRERAAFDIQRFGDRAEIQPLIGTAEAERGKDHQKAQAGDDPFISVFPFFRHKSLTSFLGFLIQYKNNTRLTGMSIYFNKYCNLMKKQGNIL